MPHDGGNAATDEPALRRRVDADRTPARSPTIALPCRPPGRVVRTQPGGELGVPGAPGRRPARTTPRRGSSRWPTTSVATGKTGSSALVVVGDHQPTAVHALAHAINAHLENVGKTVLLIAPVEVRPADKVIDLQAAHDGDGEKAGRNPAHPLQQPGLHRARPMSTSQSRSRTSASSSTSVRTRTRRRLCANGTSPKRTTSKRGATSAATMARSRSSSRSSRRCYGGKSVARVPGRRDRRRRDRDGHDIVRATGAISSTPRSEAGIFETFWQESVRSGVVAGTAAKPETQKIDGTSGPKGAPAAASGVGRTGNQLPRRPDALRRPVRQQRLAPGMPKPVTKMTWDNAVYHQPGHGRQANSRRRTSAGPAASTAGRRSASSN